MAILLRLFEKILCLRRMSLLVLLTGLHWSAMLNYPEHLILALRKGIMIGKSIGGLTTLFMVLMH
ncbi:hypothetical protein APT98_02280 [Klebsiella quasipneumoniae]|nr:hypothetical protein APT98_02280 [Klebsiella quasipneumoniae]